MPRKKSRASPIDMDDDDLFFDDNQSNSGRSIHEPLQRNAANARERARMRVLSKAFCRLKTTLPWVPADTKLSKLDTLRLAASYIAHLRALLQEEPCAAAQMFPHPLNLAWPFAFQHGGSTSTTAVSPTWPSPDSTQNTEPPTRARNAPTTTEYSQEFTDYRERNYNIERSQYADSQYSQYPYKDSNYYGVRSTYSSSSLTNNA